MFNLEELDKILDEEEQEYILSYIKEHGAKYTSNNIWDVLEKMHEDYFNGCFYE